ncbi:ribosomal protein L7/L12 [Mycobacterium sp.]|uniref:ribosomal protein L7/L12 n=1 Tax=Mycobacterium sp. TaxID=1785 RepID=UPI0026000139|nr:ribosomal protein L7/L12 [Mycobacterium sp.]MBW0014413.1 50S ribosomal protein L12 [Mycobacterium sp.]
MEEGFALINRRLALLEQQVRLLSEAVGLPCPTFASDAAVPGHGGVPAEVISLARGGNAIAAIKLYRELTGAGLREAKDVIDSL